MTDAGLYGTYVGAGRVLIKVRGGGRLLVSSHDLSLMPELVTEGGYDAPFTAFLRRVLQPTSCFVDVGANVGLFTVIGALAVWDGQVIAYEPAPQVVALLRDNVQLNWLTDRVDIRAVAAGDGTGRHAFTYDDRLQGLGGLSTPATASFEVDVVTLDVDLADCEHLDLVKIDVEGGEAAVLRGMRTFLDEERVAAVSIEMRSDAHQRLDRRNEWERLVAELARLADRGWTIALIAPDGGEVVMALADVIASEPHPNVVLRRPTTPAS